MSALLIAIDRLKTHAGIIAITGVDPTAAPPRVYPIEAPQGVVGSYIIVNLVSEPEDQPLTGDGQYFESRVSIECLADSGSKANALGEAVKSALRGVVKATLSGRTDVDIWKEGTDVTDLSDPKSLKRRILDYYIRWR